MIGDISSDHLRAELWSMTLCVTAADVLSLVLFGMGFPLPASGTQMYAD